MQKDFTKQAAKVLETARALAKKWNHPYVGTEHLLLALRREFTGVAGQILAANKVEEEKITKVIEELISPGTEMQTKRTLEFSPRLVYLLDNALLEAVRLSSEKIGTEHMLLAMLKDVDCVATRTLVTLNVNLGKVQEGILEVIGVNPREYMEDTREDKNGRNSVLAQYSTDLTAQAEEGKSIGGLIGGEAKKVNDHGKTTSCVCGSMLSKAISYSMAVLEVNASMGLIVAAPTAGSSGVVPGVLLAMQDEHGLSDEKLYQGLLNASAIGYLLMRNASVSGAEAGCQAEVGAASAMSASAIVEMMGGTPHMCLTAASLALSNLLGLVCDPIAGLVESPCQSRNAIGVANAITSAELALSGISHPIPFDEMAEAMFRVGKSLPFELRETAMGGCAGTPTGCKLGCEICK